MGNRTSKKKQSTETKDIVVVHDPKPILNLKPNLNIKDLVDTSEYKFRPGHGIFKISIDRRKLKIKESIGFTTGTKILEVLSLHDSPSIIHEHYNHMILKLGPISSVNYSDFKCKQDHRCFQCNQMIKTPELIQIYSANGQYLKEKHEELQPFFETLIPVKGIWNIITKMCDLDFEPLCSQECMFKFAEEIGWQILRWKMLLCDCANREEGKGFLLDAYEERSIDYVPPTN
jgi:hypothetical protein